MIETLRTRPDGTFTIAQFTDLHLTDGNPADQKTVALMRQVLETERPDIWEDGHEHHEGEESRHEDREQHPAGQGPLGARGDEGGAPTASCSLLD